MVKISPLLFLEIQTSWSPFQLCPHLSRFLMMKTSSLPPLEIPTSWPSFLKFPSSAHPHDTSDQFSFSYEEGDIGFLDDVSSQSELSGDFVENDSSAILETPDDSDLNGSSNLFHVTPPRSKKCPKCARGIPEPVLNIHFSLQHPGSNISSNSSPKAFHHSRTESEG